ncbi:MAG: hypothetical protein ACE5HX_05805 [bacterium]
MFDDSWELIRKELTTGKVLKNLLKAESACSLPLGIAADIISQHAIRDSIRGNKSDEEKLDPYWGTALPNIFVFLENELCLFAMRDYISPEMKKKAWAEGLKRPMPDISKTNEATLFVEVTGRREVLQIIWAKEFQDWIEEYVQKEFQEWAEEQIQHSVVSGQPFRGLVWHWGELKLMAYYVDEIAERVSSSGLKSQTFNALLREDYQSLFKRSENIANGLMPSNQSWAWEDTKKDVVTDWIIKLRSKPFHEQLQKLGVTHKAIRDSLIDALRKKEHQPSFISLDENIETSNGRNLPLIELLSVQPEQADIEEPLTDKQRKQIENVIGKIGLKIVEYRKEHPGIASAHGEVKTLSNALGHHRNTIRKYLEKIDQIKQKIEKIIKE